MSRATNNPASRARRKKVLRQAKGYWGARSKLNRAAQEAVDRGLRYAFRDRRARKRDFRRLWIVRIAAACKELQMSYGRFIRGLKVAGVALDRKALADIAVRDPAAFRELCETARRAFPAAGTAAA